MHIAFYAPLKPPDHPVPSGDRRMAGLLVQALEAAGHRVEIACRLRSRDFAGDPARQARLARLGATGARLLLRRYAKRPAAVRPRAWFTYHLYDKAPDWLGPAVARGLGVPYLAAEASLAPRRAAGPWAPGHRAVTEALAQAAAVFVVNPVDAACLPASTRLRPLPPFLDPAPYRAAAAGRAAARAALAAESALDPEIPWLLAVAMMRPGDKRASYRLLAAALERLEAHNRRPRWHLVVVGDGPARAEVERDFAGFGQGRVRFLGACDPAALPALYAACDLLVWPAVREAYGMALLEAQASGLPVLAGASGGVPAIIRDGETGRLVPEGDASAFAEALDALLAEPEALRALGAAAARRIVAEHSLPNAATRLDAVLREAVAA